MVIPGRRVKAGSDWTELADRGVIGKSRYIAIRRVTRNETRLLTCLQSSGNQQLLMFLFM